ncbi:MAG: hypothetical protein Kow0049_14060 [Stanieria sp.]
MIPLSIKLLAQAPKLAAVAGMLRVIVNRLAGIETKVLRRINFSRLFFMMIKQYLQIIPILNRDLLKKVVYA